VLVEKYLTRPRHIEIQVRRHARQRGYLFERDCSVQRRHQKVLEAPAPGMTAERRAAMGKAAVDAAKAVGYVGAGTVEFIANQDGSFYFMEMNTRLQVEHPVTEMITGLDLVEWQLRVAGEPCRWPRSSSPSTATPSRRASTPKTRQGLPALHRPAGAPGAAGRGHARARRYRRGGGRRDPPFYDPMIAKLIVWDVNRDRALARMLQALADYRVVGVANNIEFLSRLTACPAFANADLDTGLIEREKDYLFPEQAGPPAKPGWRWRWPSCCASANGPAAGRPPPEPPRRGTSATAGA
jgi:3-methylcrotonyl-CoA carboxylase alpha subunit